MIRKTGIAIMILLMGCCQGCIFAPRKAEPPGQASENTWIVPNTPKDVFLNLASGLTSKNNSNYVMSLDPNFTFIPRAADVGLVPSGALDNWTQQVEIDFLTRIKGDYPKDRMVQFGDENGRFAKEYTDEVGRAVYEGSYSITLDRGDGSAPQTYAGIARFTVLQGTKGWVLTTWEDLDINGNYPTAGYLRGTHRA